MGSTQVVRTAASRSKGAAAAKKDVSEKGRMVHIRLDLELHRKLRLVVAAEDTTLQEWITRTLEEAAKQAWPKVTHEVNP
jgi:predicted HicB family RNase H-like nuclease